MVHGIVIAKKGSDTHLYTESQMYLKSKYELRNTSLIEPNLCTVHGIATNFPKIAGVNGRLALYR